MFGSLGIFSKPNIDIQFNVGVGLRVKISHDDDRAEIMKQIIHEGGEAIRSSKRHGKRRSELKKKRDDTKKREQKLKRRPVTKKTTTLETKSKKPLKRDK